MGTATGRFITELRSTMRGSEHYGACELCGKHMAECFVAQPKREYRRVDGALYYAPVGGGAYGHADCLTNSFAPFNEPYEIPVCEEELA